MSNLVYYVLCGVLIAGVLFGLGMMSRVKTAAAGNLLSAGCTAAAIVLTLARYGILSDIVLWIAMAAGAAIGIIGAYRVKMIEMPQAVALLNGLGGAASAIVAAVAMRDDGGQGAFFHVTAMLALCVGAITLSGSLVAAGKLQKLLAQRPVRLPGHQALTIGSFVLSLVCVALAPVVAGGALAALMIICFVLSACFGILLAIRVGGADMPITISLLNSLSGVAGAIAGMAVSDPLLVAIGGVVGASGLLLTQVMCRAMNRSLAGILSGSTTVTASAPAPEPPAPRAQERTPPETLNISPDEAAASALRAAKSVILIPGYGMALAQAQILVKQLSDRLEADGKELAYAIHPVAGRMPGHMNVLLAEVDVPYEKLFELDDINPRFADCDVAVIIGANDVVNPAANTAEGTPIYGMPILNADRARRVVVCNYDLSPGYAGVANPLYDSADTVLLLGDAKETLTSLLIKYTA